jgi:RND superfamily putative drug exporter
MVTLSYNPQSTAAVNVLKNQLRPAVHAAAPALMIARLREQAKEGMPPRQAAGVAFTHAAPTVAAAGLILAGTFASLTLAGNTILSQLGFAVACGIALAAFVMAMFFSPSLTALAGQRAWWPGHKAVR